MTATLAVPKQAGAVRQEWLRLAAAAAATEKFDPTMTAELPAAVQRWLSHAILPGTPLWRSVELAMHGQIKLGRWRPFTARQVLAPPDGYIWAATARVAGLPVTGYDRVNRWGNPDGAPFGRFPFGVRVEAEAEFGGIAIPSVLRAGWWWGTSRQREGDFFRAEITSAVFT
jgi:hypothetical protein